MGRTFRYGIRIPTATMHEVPKMDVKTARARVHKLTPPRPNDVRRTASRPPSSNGSNSRTRPSTLHQEQIKDTAAGIVPGGSAGRDPGRAPHRQTAHPHPGIRAELGLTRAQGAGAAALLRAELACALDRGSAVAEDWRVCGVFKPRVAGLCGDGQGARDVRCQALRRWLFDDGILR